MNNLLYNFLYKIQTLHIKGCAFMSRNIQAMIVEDNQQLAESIRSYFVIKKGIDVVDIASNSLDAIERLKAYKLDVIILDLIMPRSDGFVLLEHLAKLENKRRPEVFVLSSLGNDAFVKRACDLGAIYYMMKPFSMADLHERIVNIIGTGKTSWMRPAHSPNNVRSSDHYLAELLSHFGISSKYKGYQYICKAVNLVITQPDLMNNITKQLYPKIGRDFNCSPLAVERSIRHVIETTYNAGALQSDDNSICDSRAKRQRPSNGEFISIISSKVKSYTSK